MQPSPRQVENDQITLSEANWTALLNMQYAMGNESWNEWGNAVALVNTRDETFFFRLVLVWYMNDVSWAQAVLRGIMRPANAIQYSNERFLKSLTISSRVWRQVQFMNCIWHLRVFFLAKSPPPSEHIDASLHSIFSPQFFLHSLLYRLQAISEPPYISLQHIYRYPPSFHLWSADHQTKSNIFSGLIRASFSVKKFENMHEPPQSRYMLHRRARKIPTDP